ncbi:hypothetical protein SGPA1_50581 [Streptomyces misionensis JCM 4497]
MRTAGHGGRARGGLDPAALPDARAGDERPRYEGPSIRRDRRARRGADRRADVQGPARRRLRRTAALRGVFAADAAHDRARGGRVRRRRPGGRVLRPGLRRRAGERLPHAVRMLQRGPDRLRRDRCADAQRLADRLAGRPRGRGPATAGRVGGGRRARLGRAGAVRLSRRGRAAGGVVRD